MLSVAITSGRMETFARTLDRVAASGVAPKLRVDALRSSFLATDAQGRSWTLDLESHRWGCLHGDRWMVEDPPQQLFIDPEVRASLEQLEAMAARAIVKGDSIQMPRNAWFRASGLAPDSSEPSTPTPSVEPVGVHAPRVAAPVVVQAVTPVERAVPRRPTIPKEHLRFAGPGFISVSNDLETPVLVARVTPVATAVHDRARASIQSPAPRRRASRESKHWVPVSIAPRLMSEQPEAHEQRAPVFLSGLAAVLFFALAAWTGDGRGYAAGLLFGFLTVTLVVLNHARRRDD